jgi:O-antigen/teichoic acid export membrane protein
VKDIVENKSESQPGNQFNLRAFSTDVLIFSVGQGILILFGFIQGLIVPKYLSVESYGYLQLFMLYSSYVGILHLGFIDGAFVRWAGKELTQIGSELKVASKFLILELAVVITPLSLLCYFLLKPPFQGIALMVLAFAFVAILGVLFTCAAQAARKFKLLTAANVGKGLVSFTLIIVFFVARKLDYQYVIFALLASQLFITFALVFWFRRYLGGKMKSPPSLWAYGKENIGIGIFVLLGNFVIALFLTIDRLMVSSFFSIDQFAIYALAITVVMVAYTFVAAVPQVFFPYLSAAAHELRVRAYQLGKPTLILAWGIILAIFFPVAWLLLFYLPQYIASLPLIQILLCTVAFGSLIQILHVSYYMAYRKQRQYFLCGIAALAVLAILVFSAIKIWGTLESVAIATLISFGVWYIINELSLKSVVGETNRGILKSLGIICCYMGAFWVSSLVTDRLVMQLVIYICLFALLTWLFSRHTIRELAAIAREIRRN